MALTSELSNKLKITAGLAVACVLYALAVPPKTAEYQAKVSAIVPAIEEVKPQPEVQAEPSWLAVCAVYGTTIEAAADCLEAKSVGGAKGMFIMVGASRLNISEKAFVDRALKVDVR